MLYASERDTDDDPGKILSEILYISGVRILSSSRTSTLEEPFYMRNCHTQFSPFKDFDKALGSGQWALIYVLK